MQIAPHLLNPSVNAELLYARSDTGTVLRMSQPRGQVGSLLFCRNYMPAPRINMRKLKDALRLKLEGGQSHQQIAAALEISKAL